MTEHLDEEVSVIAIYQAGKGAPLPYKMKRKNRVYTFRKVDLCHPVWEGKTLHHVFSVSDGAGYFRLDLNTRSQTWRLMEVTDGLPS